MSDEPLILSYLCELDGEETVVEATDPEEAAQKAAKAHAVEHGGGTYTVTVSEATDYELPLIAGEDFTVTVD